MKQIAFLTGNSNISLASCIVQDMHIIREKHPEYYSPNLHLINSKQNYLQEKKEKLKYINERKIAEMNRRLS